MSRARKFAACLRSVEQESPFARAMDAVANETPAVRWLMKAGPIAKRLNEEAKHDAE